MGNAFQKLYSGDGKPTVDAERKTSLGRDWHPTCLKCYECGRVLSPGQHAEHKGNPYCHTPCYKALFGPSLLGYGSNLASPANFARKDQQLTAEHSHRDHYADEELPAQKREIYSNSGASAARKHNLQRRSAPDVFVRSPTSDLSSAVGSEREDWKGKGKLVHSGKALSPLTNAPAPAATLWPGLRSDGSEHCRSVSVDSAPCDSATFADSAVAPVWVPRDSPRGRSKVWQTNGGGAESGYDRGTARSSSLRLTQASHGSPSLGSATTWRATRGRSSSNSDAADDELFLKHSHKEERLDPPLIYPTSSRVNGCVKLPVNGLCGPSIELADILEKVELFNSHYEGKVHHQMTVEKLPSGEIKIQGPLRIYWGLSRPIQLRHCDDVPTPPIAKWRHSLCVNVNDGPEQNSSTPHKLRTHEGPDFHSPYRPMRGIDDSILMSPVSPDDVVMRKKVRKFNTVAYRSDAPTKWKRASINGHIFNYDTSVFTPVLGSSTSVIADNTMTSPLVIATLLDKFKVENSAKDYILSIVTEKGDQTSEHILGEGDHPLLERLQLGADESNAKFFLKERTLEPQVIVPETVKLPIMEEEEEEETLPAEVEQLMILPIAVLKGILIKYEKDEEREARFLKAKYERAKRKIRQRLEELQTA